MGRTQRPKARIPSIQVRVRTRMVLRRDGHLMVRSGSIVFMTRLSWKGIQDIQKS